MHKLTPEQISKLRALRRELHSLPEISGCEEFTAKRIEQELKDLGADRIWTGVGGHGVAAEFASTNAGPTIMLRCELDGLPINEISNLPHRSQIDGKGHLCGHDGHMASLIGVAMGLRERPESGRVVLLFQPAEETGFGAKAVKEDPIWSQICPDFAFAYHNVPGRPLGEIGFRSGPSNCASRGMKINLMGKSSHAAAPEDGMSPAPAMASLMTALPALSEGEIGEANFALATLTHASLGEPAFGISPADGELRVTLRTMSDERMEKLVADACALVEEHAVHLAPTISWHDIFLSVVNDEGATLIASNAARRLQNQVYHMPTPMRWSEDFGRFGDGHPKTSLVYIGAGENHPQLHNPDYDFPDELIPVAANLFLGLVDQLLGSTRG